jgi:hypothetical protein
MGGTAWPAMSKLTPARASLALTLKPSTPTQRFRNVKARLRPDGSVANPRNTFGYCCGLRLALGPNPSLSSCFETSASAYQLLAGTFEYVLNRSLDHEVDLSASLHEGAPPLIQRDIWTNSSLCKRGRDGLC